MSIIKMMDRLNPKKIVVVSSAPQIRYQLLLQIEIAELVETALGVGWVYKDVGVGIKM
jgi:hypothetical protein